MTKRKSQKWRQCTSRIQSIDAIFTNDVGCRFDMVSRASFLSDPIVELVDDVTWKYFLPLNHRCVCVLCGRKNIVRLRMVIMLFNRVAVVCCDNQLEVFCFVVPSPLSALRDGCTSTISTTRQKTTSVTASSWTTTNDENECFADKNSVFFCCYSERKTIKRRRKEEQQKRYFKLRISVPKRQTRVIRNNERKLNASVARRRHQFIGQKNLHFHIRIKMNSFSHTNTHRRMAQKNIIEFVNELFYSQMMHCLNDVPHCVGVVNANTHTLTRFNYDARWLESSLLDWAMSSRRKRTANTA